MADSFQLLLKQNEWQSALANAFKIMGCKDNLTEIDNSLVSAITEEGGKFHDKNQYTFIDCVTSRVYDPTNSNVLEAEEIPASTQQQIRVDNIRQIAITTDLLGLTGRAWGDEGSFGQYKNLVVSQVEKCKKVYDHKKVNVGIGTLESSVGKQSQTVTLYDAEVGDTAKDTEAKNRMNAQLIAKKITDIKAELREPSNDYTDIGYLDTFDDKKMTVVWNQNWLSTINLLDVPTVYNDNYFDFNGKQLLAEFMGTKVNTTGTADGSTHRALDEYKIPVWSEDETGEGATALKGDYKSSATATEYKVVRPGELLPKGTPIVALATALTTKDNFQTSYTRLGKTIYRNVSVYDTVHAYVPDSTIICKILALGEGVKYLSGLRSSGEFQNFKNNTSNYYTTFCYSEVEALGGYPVITIRKYTA